MNVYLLFILGTLIGSFLGVVADRYQPDRWILANTIYGRSRCETCERRLGFLELIPLLSFIIWSGRCRFCRTKLSWRYPTYELIAGIVVAGVYFATIYQGVVMAILWTIVFLILFLLALIDYRTTLIPNELSLSIFILGIVITFLSQDSFGIVGGSFLGEYGALFGFRETLFVNRLAGIFTPSLLFVFLMIITGGRGMGFGDVKLIGALGVLFGWPDTIVIAGLSFVVGSLAVLPSLLRGRKGRKDTVPFGPFLVIASFLIFFWGEQILEFYFGLFPVIV
ncbi:MAG: prepilin peptidase [Anaplasmataceae bacterium]|nr:prepilin peptidase [Anaplasmataceae bacterium]